MGASVSLLSRSPGRFGGIHVAETPSRRLQFFAVGVFVSYPKKGSKRQPAVPETPGAVSGTSSPAPGRRTAAVAATTRLDGGLVHTVAVSTFCCKIGRLTIPPAVVLSACAYGTEADHARYLALQKQGPKAMVKYLKGGWKDDPDAVAAVERFAAQGKAAGDQGEAMRRILEQYAADAPAA
jgi:hypothetical protein